jgi:putative FmdB family regulatory protein
MPTYEYECSSCGRRFEMFLPMSAAAEQSCPSCGRAAQRLIGSGAAVLMRGLHGNRGGGNAPSCGRAQTCCGRDSRCDAPPCGSE